MNVSASASTDSLITLCINVLACIPCRTMYNGIGLQTARGSGTSGYVQKNLSAVNKMRQKVDYRTEEDIKRMEAALNRPPNQEILSHQRKRQIELKCLEERENLEKQG